MSYRLYPKRTLSLCKGYNTNVWHQGCDCHPTEGASCADEAGPNSLPDYVVYHESSQTHSQENTNKILKIESLIIDFLNLAEDMFAMTWILVRVPMFFATETNNTMEMLVAAIDRFQDFSELLGHSVNTYD